jgi:hypothetical protein
VLGDGRVDKIVLFTHDGPVVYTPTEAPLKNIREKKGAD